MRWSRIAAAARSPAGVSVGVLVGSAFGYAGAAWRARDRWARLAYARAALRAVGRSGA